MDQAVIILAHNDIGQLIHLAEYFSKNCDLYIHIDKKAVITEEELMSLKSLPQVQCVYQKYSVHWGGFSILRTQMYMLKEAYQKSDARTFHVISGHDYPIKTLSYFLNFFEKNKNKDFIGFNRVKPVGTDLESYYRYQYFFPYDYVNSREELHRKTCIWIKAQKKLHINRGLPSQFDKLYCGSQWFSLTRRTVETVIMYTKEHSSFYRRLKFTFAPEETYFLTVILNLCGFKNVVNKNMRFIRWHQENGNSPANLSREHFHLLAETDNIFARKIVAPFNKKLIPLIDKYLLNNDGEMIRTDGVWEYRSFSAYSYDPGLTEALYCYCNWKPCFEVLDAGCGCGYYVAALRRLGIFATGIDANPNVEILSSYLLPEGDKPCQCMRIEDAESDDNYKLVLCINVLQYITNMDSYLKVVQNIIALAKNTIVIAYNETLSRKKEEVLNVLLSRENFKENDFATKFFQRHIKKIKNIHLYERITN